MTTRLTTFLTKYTYISVNVCLNTYYSHNNIFFLLHVHDSHFNLFVIFSLKICESQQHLLGYKTISSEENVGAPPCEGGYQGVAYAIAEMLAFLVCC